MTINRNEVIPAGLGVDLANLGTEQDLVVPGAYVAITRAARGALSAPTVHRVVRVSERVLRVVRAAATTGAAARVAMGTPLGGMLAVEAAVQVVELVSKCLANKE